MHLFIKVLEIGEAILGIGLLGIIVLGFMFFSDSNTYR